MSSFDPSPSTTFGVSENQLAIQQYAYSRSETDSTARIIAQDVVQAYTYDKEYIDGIGHGGQPVTLPSLDQYAIEHPPQGSLSMNDKAIIHVANLPIDNPGAIPSAVVNYTSALTLLNTNCLLVGPTAAPTNEASCNGRILGAASDPTAVLYGTPIDQRIQYEQQLVTQGFLLDHSLTDLVVERDTQDPLRLTPYYDAGDRVIQTCADPVVDQDVVNLRTLKRLTLNRPNDITEWDAATQRISSLLDPEEIQQLDNEQVKTTKRTQAVP